MPHATLVGLGCKFPGRCPLCGRSVGARTFELAAASLYRSEGGKHYAVHTECAGGKTKNAISGGVRYRTEPDPVIAIPEGT